MSGLGRAIEEHIRRAMERGDFDDLPGKGKPLPLDENPVEDSEWRLVFSFLRGSGFSLPWIEARKEIEADLHSARTQLQRSWSWRLGCLASGKNEAWVEAEWEQALERFRERADDLNRRIFDYNLRVPSWRFQHNPILLEREIDLITQG
ncbi:MAG: DnaJ family domain-containing protein [Chloroflexota bacterium]